MKRHLQLQRDAKKKLSAAYEEGGQAVRRTYMKLESEHNIRCVEQISADERTVQPDLPLAAEA